MLVDVHCHLDHKLYEDLDTVIENARRAGVVKIITNGLDYRTNVTSLELARKYDIVEAALGRYPEDALSKEGYYKDNPGVKRKSAEDDIAFIRDHCKDIVAIGECGLDLFNGKNLESQIRVFRKLIDLSIELDKPIIIHSRKAEKEVMDILAEFQGKLYTSRIILHCFSGKKGLVKEAIERGYIFSIPTNIVRADNFRRIVEKCPLKQLLTETDGPFLSPFKDKINEPRFVMESVKEIARIKGITEQECINQIFMNYQRIF